MAKIGDRFNAGQTCTSGNYVFGGYIDGTTTPAPRQEERVIPLSKDETFPPLRSSTKACSWMLERIT